MRYPLEASLSYRLPALLVLAVFYGVYFVKQWRQSAAASAPCRSGAERMRGPTGWKR